MKPHKIIEKVFKDEFGDDWENKLRDFEHGFSDYYDCSIKAIRQALNIAAVGVSLPIERFDAEDWLGDNKDIWNHPIITDRTNKESYELADLMADFANSIIQKIIRDDNRPMQEKQEKIKHVSR